MPKKLPRYSKEFRAEAVRFYRSVKAERSLRDVSSELEISVESLRGWLKQADIDEGRQEGLTTDERKRLRDLERETAFSKKSGKS